jgi:ABC-type transport system involved in cytochrome c biogenesis permease subunit
MSEVSLFCFAASYTVALALEVLYLRRRRPVHRLAATSFGGAGLLAHTIYLAVQRPPLAWQYGLLLVLAWVVAIFYLSSVLHHKRQAWGVFVLPVVLCLVLLAVAFGPPKDGDGGRRSGFLGTEQLKTIGIAHAGLLILSAVGVSVGFVASLMYLAQAHRLKAKMLPREGVQLPSLERLEVMNRRALSLSFPLLTSGMILGMVLLLRPDDKIVDWYDPRILASVLLWLVFALLLYLRFGMHLRGRRVALLTILAFAVLLVTLVMPHMGRGGRP